MLINPSEYAVNNLFTQLDIPKKTIVLSDVDVNLGKGVKFEKLSCMEPVGQIIALAEKYNFVVVVLYKLNWDSIFRMYKNLPNNVLVLNLNAGYTGLGKKLILADLDDVYINPYVEVKEIVDLENLKFEIKSFFKNKKLTHIRIASKEMEEKIGGDELDLDYSEYINFNQFGFSGFSGLILSFGSTLQESLNVVGLLQSEGLSMDFFWVGNYKKSLSVELIQSMNNQDKIFIVGDFDSVYFRDFWYSQLYEVGIVEKEIYFICPENLRQVVPEFLSEQVKMSAQDIYKRIRDKI